MLKVALQLNSIVNQHFCLLFTKMTDDDSMMMYSLYVMEQEPTLIGLEYKMESVQVSEAVEQEGALKCRNDANSVLR